MSSVLESTGLSDAWLVDVSLVPSNADTSNAYLDGIEPQYVAGAQAAAESNSGHRSGVTNYARNYALTCGVTAGAVGAVGASIAGANTTKTTAAGMGSAVVGAAICGAVGNRQMQYASAEQSLDQTLQDSNERLAAAEKTVASAERLVDDHKSKLSTLRRQVATNSTYRTSLNNQIGAAKYDHKLLVGTQSELQATIEQLSSRIQTEPASPDVTKLNQRLADLREQNARLAQEASELAQEIDRAVRV